MTWRGRGLWELGRGGGETHRETGRMGGRLKIGENRCAYVYRLLNHSLVVPKS